MKFAKVIASTIFAATVLVDTAVAGVGVPLPMLKNITRIHIEDMSGQVKLSVKGTRNNQVATIQAIASPAIIEGCLRLAMLAKETNTGFYLSDASNIPECILAD